MICVTLTGLGERAHLANPQIGLKTAIEDIRKVIEYEDLQDIILVGHIFAGIVVAGVADKIPQRIKTLLFLDANIPMNLQSPQGNFTSWSENGRKGVLEECNDNGGGLKWPLTYKMLENMVFDMNKDDKEWVMSKVVPQPIKMFQDVISLSPDYDKITKAFIFCPRERKLKEEIRSKYKDEKYATIESGHYPMVSKPRELAEILIGLCQ